MLGPFNEVGYALIVQVKVTNGRLNARLKFVREHLKHGSDFKKSVF